MQRPAVSIIMPSYNAAAFIGAAIASVQAQTFTDWELLITDDASTDTTPEIVRQFAQTDPRVRFFALSKNSGPGVARNQSLEQARGRYIAFLDADDRWLPQKLEKQLRWMQQNGTHFTFCFYDCTDEQGNVTGQRIEAPRVLSYRQLFFCNYVGNLTGIYDSDFLGKIPISAIKKRQDWMVWLTVLRKIRYARPVPEILALYRVRAQSVSSSKFKLLKYNFAVYRDFHRLNFLASLACMGVFLFVQLLVKPRYIRRSQ